MKLDFDESVPVTDQLIRSNMRKKRGRKHNHTIGPGRVQVKRPSKIRVAKYKKYKQSVADYWAGKIDSHPTIKKD